MIGNSPGRMAACVLMVSLSKYFQSWSRLIDPSKPEVGGQSYCSTAGYLAPAALNLAAQLDMGGWYVQHGRQRARKSDTTYIQYSVLDPANTSGIS